MPTKKTEVTPEEVTVPQGEDAVSNTLQQEGSLPQTDLGNDENNPSESEMETASTPVQSSQTEPVSEAASAAGFEDALNVSENRDISQTENEIAADNPDVPPAAEENSENSNNSETDPEKPKRTRRRRKDPKENQSQSDTETNSKQENASDDISEASKSTIRATPTKPSTILSIDDELGVVTDADKARSELLDLLESYRGKKHLSGTIQGIENPTGDPSKTLAVLYHGEYKIIIPLAEVVEPPEDLKGQPLDYVLNYMLNKRLGAEVDYIIKGIDAKEKIAVGSRVEAMRNKRKNYYFGSDRDGNNLLYSDLCAEVRVVSVVRSGIFVDLFGLEVFIPLRELSYQRLMDAEKYFTPGQRTLVKILDIDRTDRRNIKVRASVKQAGENPYDKALKKYSIGNRYVGTVSLVDTNGVFVSLDGGIDCLCNYPKRGRPPRGARVTVRILGINYDTNRIWGAITHIAAAR